MKDDQTWYQARQPKLIPSRMTKVDTKQDDQSWYQEGWPKLIPSKTTKVDIKQDDQKCDTKQDDQCWYKATRLKWIHRKTIKVDSNQNGKTRWGGEQEQPPTPNPPPPLKNRCPLFYCVPRTTVQRARIIAVLSPSCRNKRRLKAGWWALRRSPSKEPIKGRYVGVCGEIHYSAVC